MKKIFILAAMVMVLPFAVSAHGGEFADADEQSATTEEIQMEQKNHEQMQELMKKFMVDGALSPDDADAMVTLMSGKMQNGGGMMGGGGADGDMMDGAAGHAGGDMKGGMMGGGMMWMGALHGLVAVTSIVWLIAGIMYLMGIRRTSRGEISQ